MAPQWAQATGHSHSCYADCLRGNADLNADVDAQGGAYATGVLVLMTSAAIRRDLGDAQARSKLDSFLIIASFSLTQRFKTFMSVQRVLRSLVFILAIVVRRWSLRVWRKLN